MASFKPKKALNYNKTIYFSLTPKISLNERIVNKAEEQAIISTKEQLRKHLVY
jgi:hypothetical protein